jgi:hypothetical protein
VNNVALLVDWLSNPLVEPILRERERDLDGHNPSTPSQAWWKYLGPAGGASTLADRTVAAAAQRFLPPRQGSADVASDRPKLTRALLGDLGSAAMRQRAPRRPDALVTTFIACQIWGGGNRGRAMAHTRTAIADPDRLRAGLSVFADGVVADAVNAVDSKHLPGWGPSFSTKLGYALTFDDAKVGGRPALIYDDRVKASLGRLGIEWSRYSGYCQLLWTAAGQLEVRPDAVEFLLFAPWFDTRLAVADW